jgi:nicotinate-nucleotide--dimethylbenzimidazole phosphoribosyltransferase
VASIAPPSAEGESAARRHLDSLTKPPGSLGRLEEIALRLAVLRGRAPEVARPVIFTFAADHGVVAEGVSAYPQVVTAQMVENFLRGGAAVNVLARQAGARVVVANFGVATPMPHSPELRECTIGPGTATSRSAPPCSESRPFARSRPARAWRRRRWTRAPISWRRVNGHRQHDGGERDHGGDHAERARAGDRTGTGVDDAALSRKVEAVRRALAVNRPDPHDGLDVLAKVGGFEIGGLAGVILAGAARRVPVALDGFIAGARGAGRGHARADARHALFASHRSAEPGHAHALAHLGLEPYLDLGLRLGEGTGAALFVHLARAAALVWSEMATFKSAGISSSEGASTAPSEASPRNSVAPAKPALEQAP